MSKFKGMFLVALLALFISACGRTPDPVTPTAKLTLTAASGQVVSGSTAALTATIDEGAENVATVEFSVKDQSAFATDDGSDGSYTAVSAVLSSNTIFVATAKDSAGTVLGSSNEVTVTVTTAPAQPNAEAKTVTTLAGVQVVGGTTPTGLAVTTEKLVVQNGTARLKGSATGGTAVVNADGTFTFTPSNGAMAGSFEYEVVSGTLVDSALVTVNITPLPANTVIVNDLAGLTAATATGSTFTTIIVNGTVVCTADPCAGLEADQRIVGVGVFEGVTLTGVARLDATRSGSEGTDPNSNNLTVIELAPNTSVEGIEISGRDIFTAINGDVADFDTSPAPDVITPSSANIRNVKIIGPTSNAPLAMRLGSAPVGSYYNLTIDGLEVTNVTRRIGLSAFNQLTITNSTFTMDDVFLNDGTTPAPNGLFIASEGASTLLLDNVDVSSATASDTFTPIFIAHGSRQGIMNVVVKNSDVTFPDATAAGLAVARSFGFDYENNQEITGRIAINTAESTNNSSEGNGRVTYEAEPRAGGALPPNDPNVVITGYIQGNNPAVFVTR